MQKFLLSILLCASVVATGSPMEVDQNNQSTDQNLQIQLVHETFTILNDLLSINSDIVLVIICLLDDASFSALTQTCKQFKYICDKIPVKCLVCITLSDAAYHDNTQLMQRFLVASYGCTQLQIPKIVKRLCCLESELGNITLYNLLMGTPLAYKTAYEIDKVTVACEYTALIDVGSQNFVFFRLQSWKIDKTREKFSKKIIEHVAIIKNSMLEDVAAKKMSYKDFKDCLKSLNVVCQNLQEDYVTFSDEPDHFVVVHMPPPSQATRYWASDYNFSRSDERRSSFLQINIIFIMAVHKKYVDIVNVILKDIGANISLVVLELAAQLTNNLEIIQMINEELERRNQELVQ